MKATLVNCVNSFQFIKLHEEQRAGELYYVITMRSNINRLTGELTTIDGKAIPDQTYKVYIPKHEKQQNY